MSLYTALFLVIFRSPSNTLKYLREKAYRGRVKDVQPLLKSLGALLSDKRGEYRSYRAL